MGIDSIKYPISFAGCFLAHTSLPPGYVCQLDWREPSTWMVLKISDLVERELEDQSWITCRTGVKYLKEYSPFTVKQLSIYLFEHCGLSLLHHRNQPIVGYLILSIVTYTTWFVRCRYVSIMSEWIVSVASLNLKWLEISVGEALYRFSWHYELCWNVKLSNCMQHQ